jgi:1,4-alpha-glucan branching enzyme
MHGWRPETCARFEADLRRLAEGRQHDPHALLGHHREPGLDRFLAHIPAATDVVLDGIGPLPRIAGSDFFALESATPLPLAPRWRLHWRDSHGHARAQVDPYSFPALTSADDLWLFSGGRHQDAWRFLGAHLRRVDDVDGVLFAVWAPNAERVSVVGPFCQWDGRRYPLRSLGVSGVWELFVPGIGAGELYKFEIRHRGGGQVALRSDPYARAAELRPATASVVAAPAAHHWGDATWLTRRGERDWLHAPMSIYEVHLGSWRRRGDGGFLSYGELIADALIPYALALGFTHVELLPVTEHPLDDSWGYQVHRLLRADQRGFGTPDDFRWFVDELPLARPRRAARLGAGAFPARRACARALRRRRRLYEYADPRKGEHREWGTLVFDYSPARGALVPGLASALHWLEEFHVDGLRVDAVASMLYLDYARPAGDWTPNRARRPREPRGDRVPARTERRWCIGALPRRADDRRGIDRRGRGHAADHRGRPRLFDEVEHGLDARHAAVLRTRTRSTAVHHHERLTFGLMYAWPRTSCCRSRTTRSCT